MKRDLITGIRPYARYHKMATVLKQTTEQHTPMEGIVHSIRRQVYAMSTIRTSLRASERYHH